MPHLLSYCKTKPKVDHYLYLVEFILAICCVACCVFCPQAFFFFFFKFGSGAEHCSTLYTSLNVTNYFLYGCLFFLEIEIKDPINLK